MKNMVGHNAIINAMDINEDGVISPEGAASILGRYDDEAHKARQFPVDCRTLATAQGIHT